jgi:hypothetical protein
MSDHFAAFSFVDRITEPALRARAICVPENLAAFPACLVASGRPAAAGSPANRFPAACGGARH